jgi:16S rRNA pseudouridine516 synthase
MSRSLEKQLRQLGYGSRRDVAAWIACGDFHDHHGKALEAGREYAHEQQGAVMLLHKPVGYVTSTRDAGRLVYDLLPSRFRHREPLLAPIGRLDKETSGLLLFTDDGQLQHRLTSPRHHVPKTYVVQVSEDLDPCLVARFASGEILLEGESKPCLPAELQILDLRKARVVLHEGRYHQVRRMFAACGNHVLALHRSHMGELGLDGLAPGQWRLLGDAELALLRPNSRHPPETTRR